MTLELKKLRSGSLRDIKIFIKENKEKLTEKELVLVTKIKDDIQSQVNNLADAFCGLNWTPMIPAFHGTKNMQTKTKLTCLLDCFTADQESHEIFLKNLQRSLDYFNKVKARAKINEK